MRSHQLCLKGDQDEEVALKLWPLLLEVVLPALTHAQINVLPDCDALLPMGVGPEVRKACETVRAMAAAQPADQPKGIRSWFRPRMLRLDARQPAHLELLQILGPFALTECHAEGSHEFVVGTGDVPTDAEVRLTDTEA